MMKIPSYHKNLETLHVNCEEPHAYFMPYDDEGKASNDERLYSNYFYSLCGDWQFKFYTSFEDLPDDFLNTSMTDIIDVPRNWQTELENGYDVPQYLNTLYPFTLDPPHVPDENPCGHYHKSFELDDDFVSEEVTINFEGVDSCFYLWLNGRFVGYSQVSHCTSEFNLTDFVKSGKNTIDVLVVKWCDGSYLEDQDCFRFSGIFREVYLLQREKIHLQDAYIRTHISDNLQSAVIKAELTLTGSTEIEYKLYDKDNTLIANGHTNDNNIKIPVDHCKLWNDEYPYLYNLILKVGHEYISFKIALKKIVIVNGIVYLNGQKVKARGINRHDSHPVFGHTVPYKHMLEDLYLLKRNNCNTIRTSHYPNDPRFVDLCDKLGFMVIDEADIETHGMGHDYDGNWDWTRWSALSTLPEWKDAYVDRAKRLFERDKNHGCIIMWSLGNESGCGCNHRHMRTYIKSRDKDALVHYENAHLQFTAVPEGEDFSDISDVESRMYADLQYTKDYLEDKKHTKPFFFCEYVCSMSTGDVYAHWNLVEKYDNLFGACIWELTDHAVQIEKDGKAAYRFGGDFGEFPHDFVGCIDGLVYPDRSPRPGLYDMKKVYQPYTITMPETGKISVESRRYFKSLDDLYISWKLRCDDIILKSGTLDMLSVRPRETKSFTLFDKASLSLCGECYLTVTVHQKHDTPWASCGFETGFEQFKIETVKKSIPVSASRPEYQDNGRFITINANNTIYTFDKSYGTLTSILCDNKERLSGNTAIEIWKAHPYNQNGLSADKKKNHMHHARQKTYQCDIAENAHNLTINCTISIGGPSFTPMIKGNLTYTFWGDASVSLSFDGKKNPLVPTLPRFGFKIPMSVKHEYIQYFGCGPHEAYPDRHKSCRTDLFTTTVTENFEHYLRPFENSSHYGTKFGSVFDAFGQGLLFIPENADTFFFNASHFTPQMLESALHDDELCPLKETIVYLDLNFDIAGGKSDYYDHFEPERNWDDSNLHFSVRIIPYDMNVSKPFEHICEELS